MRALKALVIFMGILIVAGVIIIIVTIYNRSQINPDKSLTSKFLIPQQSDIIQILELNDILDETKTELANLKQETSQFGSSLSDASSNLDDSVVLISDSVGNIEEGSSQLNALLFPIVASIAIILALQIVIIARRR